MTQEKKSTNNGQRRRAAKSKTRGIKVAYNENMPRSVVRKMLNSFMKCEQCGDRMLIKNLDAHVRKALLHSKPKATKKSKEVKPNDK